MGKQGAVIREGFPEGECISESKSYDWLSRYQTLLLNSKRYHENSGLFPLYPLSTARFESNFLSGIFF